MRVRLSPLLEQQVHHLAIRQGRTDQNMLDQLIAAGLRLTGMPSAAISSQIGGPSEGEMSEMKIPLDAKLREQLRSLAAERGRSQRRMGALVDAAGLKALGADAAIVDSAIKADEAA
jgi:predicted transcriptional regulator